PQEKINGPYGKVLTDPIPLVEPNPLSDADAKYCSCLIHVQEKGCAYSPYGVCTKSVGDQYRGCASYYKYDQFTDGELGAFMDLHKISGSGGSRSSMLSS